MPGQLSTAQLTKGMLSTLSPSERRVSVTVDEKKTPYYLTHWLCENKMVLFSPSRDVAQTNNWVNQTLPYLLDIQATAQHYVNDGHTCILPIAESERGHWVLMLWSPTELKFFDPKSSNIAVNVGNTVLGAETTQAMHDFAKNWTPMWFHNPLRTHTNDAFKAFTKCAKDNWEAVKEPFHPQGTFDMENCGRYCIQRIAAHLHLTFDDIDKVVADRSEAPWIPDYQDWVDNLMTQPPTKAVIEDFNDYPTGTVYIVPEALLPKASAVPGDSVMSFS